MGFMKQLDSYHKELYRQPQTQNQTNKEENYPFMKKVK